MPELLHVRNGLMTLLLAAGASAGAPSTPVALVNPGFEGAYGTVNGANSHITGVVAGAWRDNSAWADVDVQYARESSNPHGGTACQKITVTAVRKGEEQLKQSFSLKANSVFTASVWLRGNAGSSASLGFQKALTPFTIYADTTVALSPSWRQVTVQGYTSADEAGVLIVGVKVPGTVWVDDASVSYAPGTFGPTPNLGPISPAFFGMHVSYYGARTVRNPGMEPPFAIIGRNRPISGVIANGWTDNSEWADVTAEYSQDSNAPHGGAAAQKVCVKRIGRGAVQLVQQVSARPGQSYTLTAWLRGDPGLAVDLAIRQQYAPYTIYGIATAHISGSWQQFSVSGRVAGTDPVLLLFHTTHAGTFSVDDVTFTQSGGEPVSGGVPWPAAPVGTLRLWDSLTSWALLEPARGVFDFSTLDGWVAKARANGVRDIILTLGQTPAWASTKPDHFSYYGAGAPDPPANFQDWRDYIAAVARRYKGAIRYYEIWNEPNDTGYYSGTVNQLVELTREAYTILKSVDPQNVVISPAAYAAGYLDQFLQAGGGRYIDAVGYHIYATPPEGAGRQIADVRLVLSRNGAGWLPLFDTEGASGDATVTEDLGAAYLVRRFLVDLAFGANRFDWYEWGPANRFCAGTVENSSQALTKAGAAYGYMRGWLEGASITGALIDASGNWQIRLTMGNGSAGLIVWNPVKPLEFAIPAGIVARSQRDIYGGSAAVQGSKVVAGAAPILLSAY